ncbi:unnamed protein product [Haemonchus placei]|uniref:Ig-like domain-containing protein n=1 Tax=Haemonchus placei TaxID=6290 RepID=A0A0N4W3B9_HAEPC|nr:unnamed protein product [Haemonchus placei]
MISSDGINTGPWTRQVYVNTPAQSTPKGRQLTKNCFRFSTRPLKGEAMATMYACHTNKTIPRFLPIKRSR